MGRPGIPKGGPARIAIAERDRQILEMRKDAVTYQTIATNFGITTSRVHQIVMREIEKITSLPTESLRHLHSSLVEKTIQAINVTLSTIRSARRAEAQEIAECLSRSKHYVRRPGLPPWGAEAVYT